MGKTPHHLSIFSQEIDRVAFLVYFLGAVVPFAALAWVVERYALPQLPDGAPSAAAGGALLALGCLSLASFLALRRAARAALARLDSDNRRLETLLEASQTLADARFADDVQRTAARCAAAVTGASVAFSFASDSEKEDAAPRLVATAGDGAMELYREARARLEEVVAPVLAQALPALWTADGPEPLRALAAVPVPAADGAAARAALVVASSAPGARFEASHLRPLSTVAAQVSVARANADLRDAQRNFFVHVTEILIAALDAHQHEQRGHARRVAHLAVRLGRELQLDEHRLERLHFAALLHDVGMLKIDTRHPQGRAAYRAHPGLGQRLLARIRLWEDLAPWVLHHHECWDGSGYPEGLAGEDIPLEARIIGLAEAFDTMAGDVSYAPRGFVEALEEVRRGRGTQFEPRLADLLLDLAERGVIEPSRG
jgi:HD-GYP domain-containing protein (c-di-GMP phosphodiesterase class II)